MNINVLRLKLGDAREPVRVRVQHIIQTLPKVYGYSRISQLLLDHGLKSKVAKTRQGTLDEIGGLLKKFGIGACEPAKAFPAVASTISDKDPAVRKSALAALRSVDEMFSYDHYCSDIRIAARVMFLSGRKSGLWWATCRQRIRRNWRSGCVE